MDIGADMSQYHGCFGCGSANPAGLKLSFDWDGRQATATFVAQEKYQGWPGMVHGGILCTILDEAISWAAHYARATGVTGKLAIRLKHPVRIGEKLRISATITENSRKLCLSKAEVTLPDGTCAAEAEGTIYILPQSQPKPE